MLPQEIKLVWDLRLYACKAFFLLDLLLRQLKTVRFSYLHLQIQNKRLRYPEVWFPFPQELMSIQHCQDFYLSVPNLEFPFHMPFA